MCFEATYRAKCRIIAIFQIILYSLALIGVVNSLISITSEDGFQYSLRMQEYAWSLRISVGCGTIGVIMAVVLFIGVRQEGRLNCRIWLYFNAPSVVLSIFGLFVTCVRSGDLFYITAECLYIGLNSYFLIVVNSYINELELRKNNACNDVEEGIVLDQI